MIYVILGPTASGKSDLAEIISEKYSLPIINFDAFQVYNQINKGTAKPPIELLTSGRYFLYDFIDVNEEYDVSKYQKDARRLLNIFNENKQDVIMTGGTGLYLKACLYDYIFEDENPMPSTFYQDKSNKELYDELLSIDNEDALKIGANNRKRLLRALYIYKVHNKTKTEISGNRKDHLIFDNVCFVGLDIDREVLYDKINKRVDSMVLNGLLNEIEYIKNNFDISLRAFQAIGYKEFFLGLNDFEAVELIKKNTRNYAKRQMTFFKHQFNNISWFNSVDKAKSFIENEIKNKK